MYRPQVVLSSIALITLFIILFLLPVLIHYVNFSEVLDSSIYRIICCGVFISFSLCLYCASYIATKIVQVSLLKNHNVKRKLGISYKILDSKLISFIAIISLLIGFFLIIESVNIRINTGETNEHWSRYIAMLFLSFFL